MKLKTEYEASVTKWLYYFFIIWPFRYKHQWNFAQEPKIGKCRLKLLPKRYHITLKSSQNGKIWPNEVTLGTFEQVCYVLGLLIDLNIGPKFQVIACFASLIWKVHLICKSLWSRICYLWVLLFKPTLPHPNGFCWCHQCSWTLTSVDSMQVSNRK